MKQLPLIVAATLLVGFSVAGLDAAKPVVNSSVGSWALNVEKSTYSPGVAPKSSTLTITAAGKKVTSVIHTVAADDTATHVTYAGQYNGKAMKVTGSPMFDTASRRRISPTTTEATYRKAGRVYTVNTVVVADDGKSMTVTAKGTDAEGRAVNNMQVYDRQ
jgi:hypothetical protein